MKKRKLIHVSFDLVNGFAPRIPAQVCPGEDETIPRICVAPSIIKALQSIPQAGEVMYYMEEIGVPIIIHAYYMQSGAVLMPEQIADKVPDAVANQEMWVTEVPEDVRRVDYEIINPFTKKMKDRNGTVGRFVIGYDSLHVVGYQDNWRNLAHKISKSKEAEEWFMANMPAGITYRTLLSNLGDELLEKFGGKHGKIDYRRSNCSLQETHRKNGEGGNQTFFRNSKTGIRYS